MVKPDIWWYNKNIKKRLGCSDLKKRCAVDLLTESTAEQKERMVQCYEFKYNKA